MANQGKQILMILLFVLSIIFAFWLISFDEIIKAFIGIAIINGWFFTILAMHVTGKIRFAGDEESKKDQLENEEC